MVLYIFPSELFIVFPDFKSQETGKIALQPQGRKGAATFFVLPAFGFYDFLRENGIKKRSDAIAGLQVGPEYRHFGVVAVDI